MKKFASILLLSIISIFIYRDWFGFDLYSYGDYVYYTKENLQSLHPFSVWRGNFGLGAFDSVFWRLPQYMVYALGAKHALEFNILDRFLVMWPWIFLSSFSVYFLLSHYKLNERAKIIGTLIFAFNTYFLSISTQGHLLISIASCLSILTLLFYIKAIDTKKVIYIPLVACLLSLTSVYDLRFWYITSFLMFLYFIFKMWVTKMRLSEIIKNSVILFVIYLLYFCLNLYWIIPTVMTGGVAGGGVLARTLFGNEFLNINYSYSLFHPFWTGEQPAWFEIQDIFWFSWILPILAFLGFIYGRRKTHVVFFTIIGVIGIFLTKQASIPFSGTYEWLFNNLPGFSAFREASKFYYLIALSYGALIAYLIHHFSDSGTKRERRLAWIFIGLIVLLLAWNVKPVITREIGSLFIKRNIHYDYITFYKHLNNDPEFFRVAWLPRPSKWHNATLVHPQIGIMDMLGNDWVKYRPQEAVERYDRGKGTEAEIGIEFLDSKIGQKLLSSVSVKYVVLPIADSDNADDSYLFYGLSDQDVYKKVKEIPYLEEIDLGTQKLKVFQNNSFNNHFILSKEEDGVEGNDMGTVKFEALSPAEYRLELDGVKDSGYLIFSDGFSPLWNLTINDGRLNSTSTSIQSELNSYRLNSFYIDPSKICQNDKTCSLNSDESFSLKADLVYKPQLGYYLGARISLWSWLGAIILVGALYIKSFIKKK